MDDPDMGAWGYVYNGYGQLVSVTQEDARGCTTTLEYDLLGRLIGKSYSGGTACGETTVAPTYTYDGEDFQDDFDDSTSFGVDWMVSNPSYVYLISGKLNITGLGNGQWGTYVYRNVRTIEDGCQADSRWHRYG